MTRWKLRIAGGLTLLSVLALSPPSTHAGWRTKAEKRPKALPMDCQFGYYGTGWRAWPDGCRDGSCQLDQSLPYAPPFAAPFVPPATSLPPTWSNQPWSAPAPTMPQSTFPMPGMPMPTSPYRDYLPPQNPVPTYSVPQYAPAQQGMPPSSGFSPFAPPIFPAPYHVSPENLVPNNNPSLPPNGPTITTPPPPSPMSGQQMVPPARQAIRTMVPPPPATTMIPSSSSNGTGVQPVAAWRRNGSSAQIITLGVQLIEPDSEARPPATERRTQAPSFSSVPRSLIAPKTTPSSRTPNPVTLLTPQ